MNDELISAIAAADALLMSSYEHAVDVLAPVAGEIWMGSFTLPGKTVEGVDERSSRKVPDEIRAQVSQRDGVHLQLLPRTHNPA